MDLISSSFDRAGSRSSPRLMRLSRLSREMAPACHAATNAVTSCGVIVAVSKSLFNSIDTTSEDIAPRSWAVELHQYTQRKICVMLLLKLLEIFATMLPSPA